MNKTLKIIGVISAMFIIRYFWHSHNQSKPQSTNAVTIMSYEKYKALKHEVPYLFKLIKPQQCLFYFGANHSHDPENEQFLKLTEFWNEFLHQSSGKNCIVVLEGGTRPVHKTKDQAIIKDSEAGYATFLAQQASIPCISPEANDTFLETELLKKFNADDVYFMRFADIWHQFNEIKKNKSHQNFANYIKKFNAFLGYKNLDQFKKIYQHHFHTTFDIDDEEKIRSIINLENDTHIIGKIHQYNNVLRDKFIVNQIKKLIDEKKNIFIVFGATHCVMQEPALKSLWNS